MSNQFRRVILTFMLRDPRKGEKDKQKKAANSQQPTQLPIGEEKRERLDIFQFSVAVSC